MLSKFVALVADPKDVSTNELNVVAAALHIQAVRDLGPIWGINAGVSAFTSLSDVPLGHMPIIIKRTKSLGGLGYHWDDYRQPFAVVARAEGWSLAASHECLEMLADPTGCWTVPGSFPVSKTETKRVLYNVEVCDPCQDSGTAYLINGVVVSNFITPAYYQPMGTGGRVYDFYGKMKGPGELLAWGSKCFCDPLTGRIWVVQADGRARLKPPMDLGLPSEDTRSIREYVHAKARGVKGLDRVWDYTLNYNESPANLKRNEEVGRSARAASRAAGKLVTRAVAKPDLPF